MASALIKSAGEGPPPLPNSPLHVSTFAQELRSDLHFCTVSRLSLSPIPLVHQSPNSFHLCTFARLHLSTASSSPSPVPRTPDTRYPNRPDTCHPSPDTCFITFPPLHLCTFPLPLLPRPPPLHPTNQQLPLINQFLGHTIM